MCLLCTDFRDFFPLSGSESEEVAGSILMVGGAACSQVRLKMFTIIISRETSDCTERMLENRSPPAFCTEPKALLVFWLCKSYSQCGNCPVPLLECEIKRDNL